VTGVSTGALAAPFAFLGPRYDATLERVYTIYGDHDILRRPNLLGVFGTSLYDNAPLRNLIASFMSDAVLEAIAAEYQHGRRLLVQTTNLSAQRPVIWDLTTICASNRTDRRELVINILLASASVPAVLPPVHMKVRTEGGRTFEELHVDGGVSAQIFFAPPEIGLDDFERKAFGRKRTRTLYVIRNGQLEPVYEPVVERTLPIARRAIETMTRYQGVSDLNRLQTLAHRGNANLFYVSIPQSFAVKPTSEFDKAYMRQLFAEGVREGRAGTWMQEAPVTPVLARNGPAAN
jgi:hypothetical protein